jgi:hypothetical protein
MNKGRNRWLKTRSWPHTQSNRIFLLDEWVDDWPTLCSTLLPEFLTRNRGWFLFSCLLLSCSSSFSKVQLCQSPSAVNSLRNWHDVVKLAAVPRLRIHNCVALASSVVIPYKAGFTPKHLATGNRQPTISVTCYHIACAFSPKQPNW